jgi:DNA-binding CsgD family transcriptional regulator
MLLGNAGVGKTRLARHVALEASGMGCPTFAVRASRSATAIPLAAMVPLFTELGLDQRDSSGLLTATLTALEAVRSASNSERVVIVVDDAQHIDEASAALLDQLLGRAGTYIVLTARTRADDEGVLFDLGIADEIIRLQVEPLDSAEISALASLALGGPVARGTLEEIARASGGNVLLLRELLSGALESGAIVEIRGMWRLSGSLLGSVRLRDLIDQRLKGLGEEDRGALELVALAEPISLSMLTTLVSLVSVETLEARELVVSSADGRKSPGSSSLDNTDVRLAHPLYGEVMRAHLSPVRKARLCRALADAADGFELDDDLDLLRVAMWRLDGGGEASPERTVAALRVAFRSEDYLLASRLGRVAWRDDRSASVAVLLADSLEASAETDEAEAVLREALSGARDEDERTRLTIRLASSLFVGGVRAEEGEAMLAELGNRVTDPSVRRSIDSQRGDHLLLRGFAARAIAVDEPLLAITGDHPFAQSSRDYGVALALAGRTTEAIRHVESALSARRDLEDKEQLVSASVFLVARSLALAEAGRLEEAASSASLGYSLSVDRRNKDGQAWFSAVLALTQCTQGKLHEADHMFRESAMLYQELNHPGRRWALGGIALAAGQLGDRDTAGEAIAELDSAAPTAVRLMDVHVIRGRAWASVAAGELARGRDLFNEAAALGEQWGQHASAVAALHDLMRIDANKSIAERILAAQPLVDGSLMDARAAHARAVLSRDPADARRAAEAFEACGAMLIAAECRMLECRQAGAQGLQRQATAAEADAARLLELCGGPRTPGLSGHEAGAELSSREREVALLAAGGAQSRDIAERLFLSRRTVDNHLQRAYIKLGIKSRAELAARLGVPTTSATSRQA